MEHTVIRFIKEGSIWLLHEQKLPLFKAILIKSLKIILLSVQGFSSDLCLLRASALTLYSIMSIVPVIAMLFGIAKGFGFEKMLVQRLVEQVPDQEVTVLQVIHFAQNLLDNTQGGIVASIGLAILFWMVINVISNIEASFNAIWKIAKGRTISRKFSDYLSLMLLAPAVLTASGSISVLLKTKITWFIAVIELSDWGTWLVVQALSLSPWLLMAGLFSFIFIFMPNHKINVSAGIIAGIVTGILYHLAQSVYLSLQVGVSTYNAIYGSLAALPLFITWLQVAWMIVLFGCELAFFIQHYEIYQNNRRFSDLSFALKKVLALQITHLMIHNFCQHNKALTLSEIATQLMIPIAVIQPVLSALIASQLIVEFKPEDEDSELYQPAVDINKLTIVYVIDALEHCGQNDLPDSPQELLFMTAVDHFKSLIEASEQNYLLKNITSDTLYRKNNIACGSCVVS